MWMCVYIYTYRYIYIWIHICLYVYIQGHTLNIRCKPDKIASMVGSKVWRGPCTGSAGHGNAGGGLNNCKLQLLEGSGS